MVWVEEEEKEEEEEEERKGESHFITIVHA